MTQTYAEPVRGWRLWHVRRHGGEHRLESFTWHHVAWPPLRRLEARCAAHAGAAPVRGHECGIHAFKSRELAELLLRRYTGVRRPYYEGVTHDVRRPIALGRVSLWGRILERERGFRAQYAYPYDVFVIGGTERIAADLRRLYAVDVSGI